MVEFFNITQANAICLVDIEKFLSITLPHIERANFRIKKGVCFDPGQLSHYFHAEEEDA